MNIIPTKLKPHHVPVTPIPVEDHVEMDMCPSSVKGLTYRYSVRHNPEYYNNLDGFWYPSSAGVIKYDISDDNEEIIYEYLQKALSQKDKIVIVEIGVNRIYSEEQNSSTKVFLQNKRPQDTYIGIDIEDKKYLDDPVNNIYTVQTPSEDINTVLQFLKEHGVITIDVLMIDGKHSIDQVYKEWEYTSLLSDDGIVIFHDTNGHPGPYFVVKSIDTEMYNVYKYFTDIVDCGISVAVRK